MDTEIDDAYYGPRPIDATYGHRLEVEYLEAQQSQQAQSQTLLLSQPSLSTASLSTEKTDKPIGDTTQAPAESYVPQFGFIENIDLKIQLEIGDYINNGGAIISNNGIYYLVVIADKKVTTYKITATELQEIHSFKDKYAQSADAVTIGDTTYLVIERNQESAKLFKWKKEDKLVRVRSTIEKLTAEAIKAETEQPSLWDQFTTAVSTTISAINPFDDSTSSKESNLTQESGTMAVMTIPASNPDSDISTYGTPDDNPYTSNHSFSYDNNGNLTSDGIQCYSYSEANRLVSVEDCSTTNLIAEYSYNDSGTRVRQKLYDNGSLIKTVYNLSPFTELTVHAADATEIVNYYYYVNDQLVARDSYEVGEPSSEQRFYYHQDHLGSTSVLTDASGNTEESTEYTPYGGVLSGGTASKHQFTGQEYDHATGLNYYQSRYYNAYQRRFIQPDSIIPDAYDPQQLNPYAYVRNNPVKYTDPSGHNIFDALKGVGGCLQNIAECAADFGKPLNIFGEFLDSFDSSKNLGIGLSVAGSLKSAHRGTRIHRVIQGDFISKNPTAEQEVAISGASSKGNGNTGYADLVNYHYSNQTSEIYEIKPGSNFGQPGKIQTAKSQLNNYIVNYPGSFNNRPAKAGSIYPEFIVPDPDSPNREIVVRTYPEHPGLMIYNTRKKQDDINYKEVASYGLAAAGTALAIGFAIAGAPPNAVPLAPAF